MMTLPMLRRARGVRLPPRLGLRAFLAHRRGLAMTEFALCLPLLATVVLVGLENVHYAFAAQKVGDIATLSADAISRIRVGISEDDVNESLAGIARLGDSLRFAPNGRIIVSSIRPVLDSSGNVVDQRVRWQRCYGSLTGAASSYGTQGQNLGTTGIGPAGRKVAAIKDSELIFVETVYTYQPLININLFSGARTMRMLAGMSVRERTANDLVATGTPAPC